MLMRYLGGGIGHYKQKAGQPAVTVEEGEDKNEGIGGKGKGKGESKSKGKGEDEDKGEVDVEDGVGETNEYGGIQLEGEDDDSDAGTESGSDESVYSDTGEYEPMYEF
ncbi:hypothetical protein FRC09_019070 [Ceratobasidium sp. 395]|nr:hypothetical protein FRC09_019070 [Ceratobasidium sp. 395]